jgi:hypothetical protein
MILSSHGIIGSSIGQVDADYQAVLDYATTQGYTLPSAAQQSLQNQLVIDLKDAGIWDKLDTFGVFATDGDSDFALIDWIRLSQYTAVNSPTFTTNVGFEGNGTSAYINTNFNPSTSGVNYTLNDASRFIYSTLIGSSRALDGLQITQANCMFAQINSVGQRINQAINNTSNTQDFALNGLKVISRTSSSNVSLWVDNTEENIAVSSVSIENENQLILRRQILYGSSNVKIYGMGGTILQSDLNNAVNTYITSL